MEKRIVINKEEAIKIINSMPQDTVFLLTIDLSEEKVSDCGQLVNKQKGEKIIKESKTRIFSGNQYTSQIDLYNVFQPDIYNIKPKGIMKTILLDGIKV